MKQVYTADRLVSQLYQENPLLERLQKTDRFNIGREAVVPLHVGRSGGYSSMPAAGGTLNADDAQQVDTAVYSFKHHYFQVGLQAAVLAQTEGGSSKSVANALTLEVDGGIDDMRKQITRQVLSNGDALVAQCTTTTAATEVELLSTGYGYDAIVRGWLYPGLPVQVGTTGDRDADTASSVITAVEEVAATPSITISDAITTDSSDYVGVAKSSNAAGTAIYETNGLRQIFGSNTSAVGGLDPDTAGEGFWKPAAVETTATTLSLDKLLELHRKVRQKTGKKPTFDLTSLKQEENLFKLLQSQLRYDPAKKLGSGETTGLQWDGAEIHAQNDVPDREYYTFDPDSLFIVAKDKPRWLSKIAGNNQGLVWNTGTTKFSDAVYYPFELAVQRRNAGAAWTSITA